MKVLRFAILAAAALLATGALAEALVRDTVTSLFELYRETTPAAWQQIAVCKGLEAAELEELLSGKDTRKK